MVVGEAAGVPPAGVVGDACSLGGNGLGARMRWRTSDEGWLLVRWREGGCLGG